MPSFDPADLVDSTEVAELIGLSSNKAVSTYRARFTDFPESAVEKRSGNCVLWVRDDITTWAQAPGRS